MPLVIAYVGQEFREADMPSLELYCRTIVANRLDCSQRHLAGEDVEFVACQKSMLSPPADVFLYIEALQYEERAADFDGRIKSIKNDLVKKMPGYGFKIWAKLIGDLVSV
jgi:hypothetical protein